MNKKLLQKIFVLVIIEIFFQKISVNAQTTFFHRYTIYFTDKNNNPFSINDPEEFLSPKSIERRVKQNISFDESDIPVTPSYIDSLKSTGVYVIHTSKWLNCATIFTMDSLALEHINNFPFVQSVVITARSPLLPINNESMQNFNQQKIECGTDSHYGLGSQQITQIHGDALHEEGFTGKGMLIAMLDAGYNNAELLSIFDSLRNRGGIIAERNFVTPGGTVYANSNHGSSTLSCIASNLPGYFTGTAPDADFVLLVCEEAAAENPIEEVNWAAAAEFADSIGADVISSSLGYSLFDTAIFNHTYADMDGNSTPCSIAAHIASQKGMIVCNSAGNSGAEAWYYLTAPSDAQDILCVGAVDSSGVYAPFSGHGPTVDGRVKPDIMSRGALAYVVDANTGAVGMSNGTSFSCPIVAGLAACLWQAHPSKTNFEIIDAIRESGSTFHSPNDSMGFGLANFAYADLLLSDFSNESLKHDNVKIYPTIFSDELNVNVSFPQGQLVSLEFFDVSGRLVMSQCETIYSGFNHLHFQTQNLSGGIYFLRFNLNGTNYFERVVKI